MPFRDGLIRLGVLLALLAGTLGSRGASAAGRIGLAPLTYTGPADTASSDLSQSLHRNVATLTGSAAVDVTLPAGCAATDPGCVAQAGKASGVDGVLVGFLDHLGNSYTLRIRLISIPGGEQHEVNRLVQGGQPDLLPTGELSLCQLLTTERCLGTLHVDGVPQAHVIVDDQDVGTVPYADQVAIGRHKVHATLDGKTSDTQYATISFKQEIDLHLTNQNGLLAFQKDDFSALPDLPPIPDMPVAPPPAVVAAPPPPAPDSSSALVIALPPSQPAVVVAPPPPPPPPAPAPAPIAVVVTPPPAPPPPPVVLAPPPPPPVVVAPPPPPVIVAAPPPPAQAADSSAQDHFVPHFEATPPLPATPAANPPATSESLTVPLPSQQSAAPESATAQPAPAPPPPTATANPAPAAATAPPPIVAKEGPKTAPAGNNAPWLRQAVIGSGVAGGVFLVTAVVLASVTQANTNAWNSAYAKNDLTVSNKSMENSIHQEAIATNVCYGLTGAAVITGLGFFLANPHMFSHPAGTGGDAPPSPPSNVPQFSVGPTGASIGGHF